MVFKNRLKQGVKDKAVMSVPDETTRVIGSSLAGSRLAPRWSFMPCSGGTWMVLLLVVP